MALVIFPLLCDREYHPSPGTFHLPQVKLCAHQTLAPYCLLTQSLPNTNLFSLSMNLTTPEPHVSGIMQYSYFSD